MSPPAPRIVAAAIAAALVVTLVACGVRTEDDARFVAEDQVPFDLLEVPTTQPPTAAEPSATPSSVELCFVDDGLIVPASRPAEPDLDLSAVVELLGDGPSELEDAAGLGTALPDDAIAGPIESAGGVAEVDLAGTFTDTGGQLQMLAIAQLVCTLTARPGIGQVAFTLDGGSISVPRGDASTTTDPVTRDDYRRLIANFDSPERR